MTGPAEVIGLTQSIAYAEHLAAEAGQHGPDANEGYLSRLAAARVTGAGLLTGGDMLQAFADAAAASAAHAAELAKQLGVQEAYDQAPDAGDKTYLTGDDASSGAAAHPGPTQAKESPVDDDGPIDRLTGLRPKALAAYRDYNKATYPFLYRRTEQERIEAEHDARPELVEQGRRTTEWWRAAAAALQTRTEEIDRMVAALRPGDRVRLVDDPDGVVWTVGDVRDGNDGWVWLGLLRTREDGTEVGTGCRARAVDLVAAATDDEYADAVKAELESGLKSGWLTPRAYRAALRRLEKTGARR